MAADALARFEAEAALPSPERLLVAMDAGQAAGSDRRGLQCAALVQTTTEDIPDTDLRVDNRPAPLRELCYLLASGGMSGGFEIAGRAV